MEFCLATIVTLVKEALYESISDEDMINLLIADMVLKLKLKSKTGDSYYMDKRLASKLMNNKMNVPIILRKSLSKEEASVDSIEKYFAKTLMPRLVPEKIDSLCRKMIDSYMDYEDISDITLSEVNNCFDKNRVARVLAYMFRLSLLVPNKIDNRSQASD